MNQRRVITLVLAAVLAAAASLLVSTIGTAEPAQSLHGLGVVYLHGRAGGPGGVSGGLISGQKKEGAVVPPPEMPCSFHRRYDATFDQAMAEIDAAIASVKAESANRIVLLGHSLGANAV